MIGRIMKTGYHIDGDELIYDIYGRREDGKKMKLEVYGTEPYFLTPKNPRNLLSKNEVKRIEKEGKSIEGEQLWKITTEIPSDVSHLRNLVKPHFEADILYRNRVRFDNGWKQYVEYPEDERMYKEEDIKSIEYEGGIKPRVCVADIEVWDKRGDSALDTDNTTEEIVSISLYDSFLDRYCVILKGKYVGEGYKEYIDEEIAKANVDITYDSVVTTVPTENHLYSKLEEWIENTKMDIFTGWNFDRYDFPYLVNRAKTLQRRTNYFNMPVVFDIMKGNNKLTHKTIRNKLNVQAKRLLGVEKLNTPKIHEMYNDDMDLLVAYNLWDTILTKEIMEYKGMVDFFPKLSNVCGVDISNCINQSDIAEGYIFHMLEELS